MKREKVYRILMLEDLENDAILIKRAAKKALPNAVFSIATNKAEFIERLGWQTPHIILSDYHLPAYNGIDAMKYARKTHAHIPFIFVTGTLNDEEKVAQAILGGASGYVLKDNLRSLKSVIEQVLEAERSLYEAAENERKKIRTANLRLQKITSILAGLDIDASAKKDILELLNELKSDIAIPEALGTEVID